ncbi:MAG: hypothetical protein AAF706_00115 [Bacteroidota bacterium]
MNKSIKKQGNAAVSAYVLKLIVLLGAFNLASCSCKSDQVAAPTLESTDVVGAERTLTFAIRNNDSAEQDYSEYVAVIDPKVNPRATQTATNGAIQVGTQTGDAQNPITVKLKDIVGGPFKVLPNATQDIAVEFTSLNATHDDSAEVTVTIQDASGKKVVDKVAKVTGIS